MNDHGGISVHARWLFCCLMLCICSASQVEAQESTSWLPFGALEKSETRSSSYSSGTKPDSKPSSLWFKWPSGSSEAKPKSSMSAAASRAGRKSKKWLDNTVDFMNPFGDEEHAQAHGYQPNFLRERNKAKKAKSSGMFDWTRKEEDPGPASVNEWGEQPRPEWHWFKT